MQPNKKKNPFKNLVGVKFFKDNGDDLELIRLIKVSTSDEMPRNVTVLDLSNNEKRTMETSELKEWTPLEPDGYMTFNIVALHDPDGNEYKDVIVTIAKMLIMKYIGDMKPYAICRQSISDIFASAYIVESENEQLAGLSVNQDNCPANFDYMMMLGCDEIIRTKHFNFYRTDTLERDILPNIRTTSFDNVLHKLYETHLETEGHLERLDVVDSDKGWCKDLTTLLKENNFQSDMNDMLGITDVQFKIPDYIVQKELPGHPGEMYDAPTDDLKLWLSSIYKVNISDATILKYNHDINMGEFNNATYFFLRDSESDLYLVVYNVAGEYLEADLEAKREEHDFSTNFRIAFYNKYNRDINAKDIFN